MMFNRYFCGIIGVLLLAVLPVCAQPKLSGYGAIKEAGSSNANNFPKLSDLEKEVLSIINIARTQPEAFIDNYLKDYNPSPGSPASTSLVKLLRQMVPVAPLVAIQPLNKIAYLHTRDMAAHSTVSSTSSNGMPYYDRLHSFYPGSKAYAEAYTAGSTNAIEIAMMLLVAPNDSTRSTRYKLLSGVVDVAGISIQPHPTTCNLVVIDIAKKQIDYATGNTQGGNIARVDYNNKPPIGYNDCPKSSKIIKRKIPNGRKRFWLF